MSNDWIARVDKIKGKYFPSSKIDLVDCFYRLHGAIQARKLLLDEAHQFNLDRKIIQKEINEEKKSLHRLNQLSFGTIDQLNIIIQHKKKLCEDLKNFLDHTTPIIPVKKTFYSITKMYIQALAAIFHSATGEKPECLRGKYYDEENYYHG